MLDSISVIGLFNIEHTSAFPMQQAAGVLFRMLHRTTATHTMMVFANSGTACDFVKYCSRDTAADGRKFYLWQTAGNSFSRKSQPCRKGICPDDVTTSTLEGYFSILRRGIKVFISNVLKRTFIIIQRNAVVKGDERKRLTYLQPR
jgi:hypothetical protein